MMNQDQQRFYWLDAATGTVFLNEAELPPKKGRLYLVVSRAELFYSSFALNSGKRVKDGNILNIQGHYIPFKKDFTNLIYSVEKQADRRFFCWVGPQLEATDSYFYDEVPESLLFKGDPVNLKRYVLFVFQRLGGFEIIYYDGGDFYSVLEKESDGIVDGIIRTARKFGLNKRIALFSDVDIPHLDRLPDKYELTVDRARSTDRYFFLPDHGPMKKRYSNISLNKQMKSIKTIVRRWNRNLTVIGVLALLLLLLNGLGYFLLKGDNNRLKEDYERVDALDRRAEFIRFGVNKIKTKLQTYPDHMVYLKAVADCFDENTTLISYALEDGRITLEGYAVDSLGLLTRLRKSNGFKEVRFKTTVTKNVYSQREKFEIEMIYENGTDENGTKE